MNMSGQKCVHCGRDHDGNRTYKKNCTGIKLFGMQTDVSSIAAAGKCKSGLKYRLMRRVSTVNCQDQFFIFFLTYICCDIFKNFCFNMLAY